MPTYTVITCLNTLNLRFGRLAVLYSGADWSEALRCARTAPNEEFCSLITSIHVFRTDENRISLATYKTAREGNGLLLLEITKVARTEGGEEQQEWHEAFFGGQIASVPR